MDDAVASTGTISVVVATRDRPAALARCLEAIQSGARPADEVVVVDQGKTPVELPPSASLVYVRQAPLGLSAARNAGLEAASGGLVAITDDDCVPTQEWLAAVVDALHDVSLDAVTGPVLPLGPPTPNTYPVSSRSSTEAATYTRGAVPWQVGTGGNFAARAEWFRRLGGYDERLGAGSRGGAGEDVDLLYRLLRAGARIGYEPRALVYHERQSAERRRATRRSYGRGVGAFWALQARRGDFHSLPLLGSWVALRGALLLRALSARRGEAVAEEARVLAGTVSGIGYGLLVRGRPERSSERSHG